MDFSRYSLEQLEDLRHAIDRRAFPQNFEKLLEALEWRRQQQAQAASIFAGRFTSQEGFLGWLQAKRRRSPVYGNGSIELTADGVLLRGWQRTWLGIRQQSVVPIPASSVCNVAHDGAALRFECQRRFGWRRLVQFVAQSAEAAERLAHNLPSRQTSGFEKRWTELQDFNRLLSAAGRRIQVTPALVILNLAVFAVMALQVKTINPFAAQQLLSWGANFGPLTIGGQWWRLVTALFVHASLAHVLLNMWALWNVGRLTERLFGSITLLALYFSTGVLASLTSISWDSSHYSVGASGAIFGLLGAFLAFLAQSGNKVPTAILRAHWLSTLVFVLFNLLSGALQNGIDNAAHVGGLISGLVLGWLLGSPLDQALPRPARYRRIALAGAFVAAFVLAALWQTRTIGMSLTAPEQFMRTHQWFYTGEPQNLRRWQDLGTRGAAGTISDEEFGQRFASEILPFWKAARQRLEHEPKSGSPAQQAFASLVLRYVGLRTDWTEAIVDATTKQDAARAREATQLAEQTDLALARLERLQLRAAMERRPQSLSHSVIAMRLKSALTGAVWRCVPNPIFHGRPVAATDDKADSPAALALAACQAQRLFQTGEYATLDALMRRHGTGLADLPDGSSTFSGLVSGLDTLFEYGSLDVQSVLERTADWRRAVRDSVNPDLVEAMAFNDWACVHADMALRTR
jgi:rhomboid protease GluP